MTSIVFLYIKASLEILMDAIYRDDPQFAFLPSIFPNRTFFILQKIQPNFCMQNLLLYINILFKVLRFAF